MFGEVGVDPLRAFANKISVASPRETDPICSSTLTPGRNWASAGVIEPIGFWADELIDRFFLPTVEALLYGGELYGLPMAFKTLAYYDKSLVATPPRTTDELITVAKALRERDESIWGLAYNSTVFTSMRRGCTGLVVGKDDNDTLSLHEPEAVKSVEFVRRLVAEERIVPEEISSALVTALFKQHKLAFVLSGPWFRGELEGVENWGVAQLPVVSETGLHAKPFLGVEAIFLNAFGERKRTAFGLMKHLTSDQQSLARLRDGSQLVANQSAYSDASVQNDPFASAFRAQVVQTRPLSNRPHMRRVWTPIKRALSQGISRGRPATEALSERSTPFAGRRGSMAERPIGRSDL